MSKSLKRNPPTEKIEKKILIACEGSDTEPLYFNAIRQDLRLPEGRITVTPHDGTDPLRVVNNVLKARQVRKADKTWEKEDSAWAVFDGDEHIANDPANWHKAIQKAKSQKVNLAITNPSIEFWYLIHFQDYYPNISRDKAKERLKQYIPNYDKSICYYPSRLKALTQESIDRASKLESLTKLNNLPEYSNPSCSGISQLIKMILDLDSENTETKGQQSEESVASIIVDLFHQLYCYDAIWREPIILKLLFYILASLIL